MSSPVTPDPNWVKRIGGAVALWASICGLGLLADLSPRPVLLAGLCAALSLTYWTMADTFQLADTTDWHIPHELISRPRGADARVVAIERLVASNADSESSRLRLRSLMSDLVDERLLSLHGIDRHSDPTGARAALGQDLADFITSTDAAPKPLHLDRMSLLLNRIESL